MEDTFLTPSIVTQTADTETLRLEKGIRPQFTRFDKVPQRELERKTYPFRGILGSQVKRSLGSRWGNYKVYP
jgi:hypothetical protein